MGIYNDLRVEIESLSFNIGDDETVVMVVPTGELMEIIYNYTRQGKLTEEFARHMNVELAEHNFKSGDIDLVYQGDALEVVDNALSSAVIRYPQTKWERDLAVSQLKVLGTGLGEELQSARKRIRAEAVQEFAERMKEKSHYKEIPKGYSKSEIIFEVTPQDINAIAEEMIAETEMQEITDQQLKDWLHEQVSDLTDGKMYQMVMPVSHADKLSPQTIFDIFQSYRLPELEERKKFQTFFDCLYHRVCYGELQQAVDIAEERLLVQVRQRLEKRSPAFQEAMHESVGDGLDLLDLGGYEGTKIDLEAFLDRPYRMNLMFATDRERKYPDSITQQYSADPDSFPFRDFDSYEKVSDNALTYLIHQQGHTVSELYDCLHKSIGSGFIYSVATELEETDATIQELTALVTLSGKQLLAVLEAIAKGDGNLCIGIASVIGLFDKRSGRGSELEIHLEKDAIFPASMVSDLQMEGVDPSGLERRYTVGSVYELNGRFWERGGVTVTDEQPQLREENMAETLEKLRDYFEPNKDMPER